MLRGPVFPDIQRFKTISPNCVHRREPITATTTISPYLLFTFIENEKKRLKPLVNETHLIVWSRDWNLFIVQWTLLPSPPWATIVLNLNFLPALEGSSTLQPASAAATIQRLPSQQLLPTLCSGI